MIGKGKIRDGRTILLRKITASSDSILALFATSMTTEKSYCHSARCWNTWWRATNFSSTTTICWIWGLALTTVGSSLPKRLVLLDFSLPGGPKDLSKKDVVLYVHVKHNPPPVLHSRPSVTCAVQLRTSLSFACSCIHFISAAILLKQCNHTVVWKRTLLWRNTVQAFIPCDVVLHRWRITLLVSKVFCWLAGAGPCINKLNAT